MNEVEKMYETIFGKFASNCSLCVKLIDCNIFNNTHNCNKFECDYQRLFTAEKQLELIKWLAKFDDFYVLKDFEFDKYRSLCGLFASEYIDTFEEMLANLILNIWDELTKAQKKQIKEILE